uniref:Uncharacterized protein n=1 Tax=Pongo abelii TaxID=9601 RepID=A0A8I5TWE2_PONAB
LCKISQSGSPGLKRSSHHSLWSALMSVICFEMYQNGDELMGGEKDAICLPWPPKEAEAGESLESMRQRLHWEAEVRGLLESCCLLSQDTTEHTNEATEAQVLLFSQLINYPSTNTSLILWEAEASRSPEEFENQPMCMYREMKKKKNKDSRLASPILNYVFPPPR